MTHRHGIYMASKTDHAQRWRILRDEKGWPIISTWIDEAGPGQTKDYGDLWVRITKEVTTAELLIMYVETGELIKGALIELGMALAAGVPVVIIGSSPLINTAIFHPSVKLLGSVGEALKEYKG